MQPMSATSLVFKSLCIGTALAHSLTHVTVHPNVRWLYHTPVGWSIYHTRNGIQEFEMACNCFSTSEPGGKTAAL